jgi:hypothetical protein
VPPLHKVNRLNSFARLKRTLIFKWCMIRCGSKNGHQKHIICLDEIGLHAHNLLTIVGSIVINIRGGTYMGI